MNESQFIKCYPKVFDKSVCEDMINLYERLWREETERIQKMSLCYDTQGNKTCGACDCQRLDIMQHEEFAPYINSSIKYLQSTINQYIEEAKLHRSQWPRKHGYENMRIKRYFADDKQQHDLHSDVNSRDTAKRFLSIICYLNDNFEGGETIFPHFNFKTKVETGSVLLFPCSWSYLHKGNPVKKGHAKYVLGTFLNYIDDGQTLNRVGDITLGTKGI